MNDSARTEKEIAALLRSGGGNGAARAAVESSRRRLEEISRIDALSGVVEVGSGVELGRIERELRPRELSLGPLSPAMAGLEVGRFLEGPYAGLRALPGGALESSCIALTAIMPDGLRYVSRPSPRSATGPDLDALFLGGEGRFGVITSATLRLFGRPRTERWATFNFGSVDRAIGFMRSAVGSGAWLRAAALARQGDRISVGLEMIGLPEAVERDLATVGHEAAARGARSSGRDLDPEAPVDRAERELSWEQLGQAIGAGTRLRCWRLALESVVVAGADEWGISLSPGGAWANREVLTAALAVADPRRVLGGVP